MNFQHPLWPSLKHPLKIKYFSKKLTTNYQLSKNALNPNPRVTELKLNASCEAPQYASGYGIKR